MSGIQNIFIDEYGDANLDTIKEGVSNCYIITAVLVDENSLEKENEKAKSIINQYFPNGELKSSSIGRNKARRLKIISDISILRFHFYSIVFDKCEIKKDSGLQYKEQFIKYLSKHLYEALFTHFQSLNIYSDEHGSSEFMRGFEKYILDVIEDNFFDHRTFKFVDSKNYPFVQTADLISGTLARLYDPKKIHKDSSKFFELMKSKCLGIDEWPTRYKIKNYSSVKVPKYSYDLIIVEQALRQAEIFIAKNNSASDSDVGLQVRALKYLLFYFRFVSQIDYVPTKDLIDHLSAISPQDISEHKLRLSVIAKLRDSNVIIASSSNGYKIPINMNDMYDFAERTNSVVLPMLDRIEKARKQYLFSSKNTIDILNPPKFEELKKIIDAKNANRIIDESK